MVLIKAQANPIARNFIEDIFNLFILQDVLEFNT